MQRTFNYVGYTYDDRVDYTGPGDFTCGQCWRLKSPAAMGFYSSATGYGSSMYGMGAGWRPSGSGWVAQIGNLRIDYNSLGDGIHTFGFSGGEVNYYSHGGQDRALAFGILYNDHYESWQYTSYGSEAATVIAYTFAGKNGGVLPSRTQVNYWVNNYDKIKKAYYSQLPVVFASAGAPAAWMVEQQTQNEPCPDCPNPPTTTVDLPWRDVATAELTIWGAAFTIAEHNSKPLYQGAKSWAAEAKLAGKVGNKLGALGLVITGADMITNGVNTSNTLEATFGVVSFLGLPGAIIGGVYFGANIVTVFTTGKSIGQHIDNNFYILPGIVGGPPIMLIPKK